MTMGRHGIFQIAGFTANRTFVWFLIGMMGGWGSDGAAHGSNQRTWKGLRSKKLTGSGGALAELDSSVGGGWRLAPPQDLKKNYLC